MEEPSRYSPWGCKESDRTERLQFHFGKHYYKARRGDGILAELFQILKDDAVKVPHSVCQQRGKLSHGHRTENSQFSFQSQRKTMPKNAQTATQLHLSHSLVKKCSKFSKPGFSNT